jgi:hypothetical protein
MVARTQPEVVVPAMITLSEPSSVRDDLFDKERACQLRPGEPAEVDGPSALTSHRRSGASSVRSTPPAPLRQRPAFQGQNLSITSMTTKPRS